jgi:cytochrome c oxidase assembly protein subunit 15
MPTQALYDLTPAWRVLLLGAMVALIPLLWVARRNQTSVRYLQALAVVTLFLTLDLVMFGSFTRLTDSGLGCPDWPGCYGHGSPLGAASPIELAQNTMPTGPVTHGKAWIEMVHRYLATAVGALILLLTLLHRRLGKRAGWVGPSWLWSLSALVWVCVQGAFGALTVTMKLFPAIVSLHLLGGIVLLMLLTVVSAGLHPPLQTRWPGEAPPPGRKRVIGALLAVVMLQIALGGWVSTNYAVLACAEFPACQGVWWPPMDFSNGFTLWHGLGLTAEGQFLTFAALTAVHMTHRLFAVVVLAGLIGLVIKLWPAPGLRQWAGLLLALMLLQVGTGIGNVVLGWPLLVAVLHTAGAAAIAMTLVALLVMGQRDTRGERA